MTFSCPMCSYQNPKGSSSCAKCLVVFEKVEQKNLGIQNKVSASSYLQELWEHVISDYGNKEFHEKFVQTALAEKNLPFASQQYRKMIEINVADDIAIKMRDRIIQLVTVTYVPHARPPLAENKRWGVKIFVFIIFVILLVLVLQVALK